MVASSVVTNSVRTMLSGNAPQGNTSALKARSFSAVPVITVLIVICAHAFVLATGLTDRTAVLQLHLVFVTIEV